MFALLCKMVQKYDFGKIVLSLFPMPLVRYINGHVLNSYGCKNGKKQFIRLEIESEPN